MSTAQRRTILVMCLVLVVSGMIAYARAGGSAQQQTAPTSVPSGSLPPTSDTDAAPAVTPLGTVPRGTYPEVVTNDGVVISEEDAAAISTSPSTTLAPVSTASPASSSDAPTTTVPDVATNEFAVIEIAQHFASEYYSYSETDTPALWQERVGALTTDSLSSSLRIEAYDEGISTVGATFPTEEVTGELGDDYASFTVYVEQTQYDRGVKGPSLTLPMTVVLVKQEGRWLVADFYPPT